MMDVAGWQLGIVPAIALDCEPHQNIRAANGILSCRIRRSGGKAGIQPVTSLYQSDNFGVNAE